ncbi:MAG: fused MFS/spermidine synthase [Chloroflexota bacterium]|nr:fused MFS/spermidine synthase [Chloroflexota bacterium]
MKLRQKLWSPHLLVFLSSACVMVIELVASRLIAPRVGVSLYTWTSVIGVILAGISLGNYIGGRLADWRASMTMLGAVFSLASLSTLAILWLNNDFHDFQLSFDAPFMLWIVLYIGAVFLLPSLILGCISPIVVKLSLTDLERTGRTVGKIYAWSSVGSIVGTFATGFFLIAYLGTKTTILAVAGLLLALGLWFVSAVSWPRALLRMLVIGGFFAFGIFRLQQGGFLRSECLRESNYFCINVHEVEKGGRQVKELLLDRLVHSYSDVDDPTFLAYGYEQIYAQTLEPLAEEDPAMDAFFIGGGGYTFPRYMEATLPESEIVVAEIDPQVTEVAYQHLGLEEDTRIKTFSMDARNYLSWEAEPNSFDVVFGDAFNDFSVPYHLTTLEFDRLVDRVLRKDGLYLVNIVDGGPYGHFFRAFVGTLQRVFPHVVVIPSSPSWRDDVRTTFVLLASHHPVDLSALSEDYTPLTEEELRDYMQREPYVLLTDDHVPVDNLMAPVVDASFRGTTVDQSIVERIEERILVVSIGALAILASGLGWGVYRWRFA